MRSTEFNGHISISNNDGETWEENTDLSPKNWSGITSSSDGTRLAATAFNGTIWTSLDSGLNWVERTPIASALWSAITSNSDGTRLAAVVDNGNIWTSTDSGANWVEHTSIASAEWSAITSSPDGLKLAACAYGGNVWISNDGGMNWQEVTWTELKSNQRQWSGIKISGDGRIVAFTGWNRLKSRSASAGTISMQPRSVTRLIFTNRLNLGPLVLMFVPSPHP